MDVKYERMMNGNFVVAVVLDANGRSWKMLFLLLLALRRRTMKS